MHIRHIMHTHTSDTCLPPPHTLTLKLSPNDPSSHCTHTHSHHSALPGRTHSMHTHTQTCVHAPGPTHTSVPFLLDTQTHTPSLPPADADPCPSSQEPTLTNAPKGRCDSTPTPRMRRPKDKEAEPHVCGHSSGSQNKETLALHALWRKAAQGERGSTARVTASTHPDRQPPFLCRSSTCPYSSHHRSGVHCDGFCPQARPLPPSLCLALPSLEGGHLLLGHRQGAGVGDTNLDPGAACAICAPSPESRVP